MIVFNGGKIRAIRVFWDQATVLKQLEIVGARGRGWPITDGTAQIELINKTSMFSKICSNIVDVPEDEFKHAKVESAPAPVNTASESAAPTPSALSPIITANIPENTKRQSMQTPSRRTYSITGDIDTPVDVAEQKRLPRIGWQNMRQDFLLSQEGDVPLKDRSPVRLPRVGQAPRREFSFSNLAEVYKAQETPTRNPKQATHFEFEEHTEESATAKPSVGGGKGGVLHHDIFETPDDDTPRPVKRQINPRAMHHETIFHDADTTPVGTVKPSIGGGTGGRRPEETIFVEHADDDNAVKPQKSPITRRDQQAHFSFADASPSTPAPKTKHTSLQHFSIEGTPDPNESEYRARALQRKEVNHFRPDTVPHFEFVDNPQEAAGSKKENSDGMNKLLKGIGRSWQMGTDSPSVAHHQRNGLSKDYLQTHFSIGDKSDDEKENGRSTQSRTKR
jgi:hypothetical protein